MWSPFTTSLSIVRISSFTINRPAGNVVHSMSSSRVRGRASTRPIAGVDNNSLIVHAADTIFPWFMGHRGEHSSELRTKLLQQRNQVAC